MERRQEKQVHLPLKGFNSEHIYLPSCTFRMAEPIAKLYKKMIRTDQSVEQAVKVCKQAHYHLLMQTSQATQLIPRTNQTIRAETRFNVGLPCSVRHASGQFESLIDNLSVHGARLKHDLSPTAHAHTTGDTLLLCVRRTEHYSFKKLWGQYQIRHVDAGRLACELIDADSAYTEAILRIVNQIRWRHAIDQKDLFLHFLSMTEQDIRAQLNLTGPTQVAFHTLESGAQVYCSTKHLPVSERSVQDTFLSLPVTGNRAKAVHALAKHSPYLHQLASRLLYGRIRCITWVPEFRQ